MRVVRQQIQSLSRLLSGATRALSSLPPAGRIAACHVPVFALGFAMLVLYPWQAQPSNSDRAVPELKHFWMFFRRLLILSLMGRYKMSRNTGIDCLRGVSMAIVFILHYCQLLPHDFFSVKSEHVYDAVLNGHYGVMMFFAISGFLIASNTIRRYGTLPKVSIREFYIMRASRILPLFLLLLIVLSTLDYAGVRGFVIGPDRSLAQIVLYAITLRFNLYFLHFKGWELFAWTILWSLSIEEVFYLAFPLLCRIGRWTMLLIGLFGGLFCYGWYYRSVPGNQPWDYFGCFDMMALGVLTALAGAAPFGQRLPGWVRLILSAGGLILIFVEYQGPHLLDNRVWGPSLVAVGTAMALLACGNAAPATQPRGFLLMTAPLRLLGRYSYEFYLMHASIILTVQQYLWQWGDRPYLYLSATFTTILAGSVVLGRCVGEPSNRRLRRLLMGRLGLVPSAGAGGQAATISSHA